jgi:predicted nuclease with TOPRIM domain
MGKDLDSEFGKIRQAFGTIKNEMDDHLNSINENTNELNSVLDYMKHIEEMISKLGERLDGLEMRMNDAQGIRKDFSVLKSIVLDNTEKDIFKLLYESNGNLFDYRRMARHLGLTEEAVKSSAEGMLIKGIPIIKKYFDNKVFLVLDSDFCSLQAKENVIRF